jgi:hypothetical protein
MTARKTFRAQHAGLLRYFLFPVRVDAGIAKRGKFRIIYRGKSGHRPFVRPILFQISGAM